MKFEYKKFVGKNYGSIKVEDTYPCCTKLQEYLDYGVDMNTRGEDVLGLYINDPNFNRVQIDFCPFCGAEIETVCLGKFKRVTKEVRVND